MAPRLKVFCTTNGLTQYAVATTSKAKALAAWGTKQDLFKEGLASETDEAALVKAALASPGGVVTRSAMDARALLAGATKPKKGKKAATPKPAKPKRPSKEARERVARAERKLAEHDARHKAALREIDERRAALEEEERELRGAYAAKRRELQKRLLDAQSALEG